MKTKKLTKKAMVFTAARVRQSDLELMRAAAAREGISQSEFFRVSIRERARRVLFNEGAEVQERQSRIGAA
jgi:uncharacterized protein (DUF1778 family)